MPPYRRYFYWRKRRNRWRPWNRYATRQRIRKAILRRKRRWRRRRVRRLRFLKKRLKTIKVKEWQPKFIKTCLIKGQLCLFQCGAGRTHHNWSQYTKSYVPISEPGGGGWSAIVISLNALWDEFQCLRNWWTASNKGLPLCRFLGGYIKFYRSLNTDYVVTIQTCPPFTDTELLHLQAQPSRQLMTKNKIIVPALHRKNYKKAYIKKKIYPPSQFKNNWYFQQDFAPQNFILLLTSATSLDQYYLSQLSVSNNITLISIDTTLFQNPNFVGISQTTGYQPKPNLYLYASQLEKPTKWTDLIYLGNTERYTEGTHIQNNSLGDKNTWGNPFVPDYLSSDLHVFLSQSIPSGTTIPENLLTETHTLYRQCRYNPHTDTGLGNQAFFKSTSISKDKIYDPPSNPDIIITGFPLWLLLWGWDDWQRKLHSINQIELNYYLVVITNFVTPKLPGYVFVDDFFLHHHKQEDLNETQKAHWHPRLAYQEQSIENICLAGPGTPKITTSKSIEAKCLYNFRFKWGGCPAKTQEIKDPTSQPKYPIPNNQRQTTEIEDPNTDKTTYLYDFDWRRDELTGPCAKRLKKAKETTVITANPTDPQTETYKMESDSTSTEEEDHQEEEPLSREQQQLLLVRKFRRHLKRKLHRLKKKL
nr:MAG: ORF1 [TTV-like mini virus]